MFLATRFCGRLVATASLALCARSSGIFPPSLPLPIILDAAGCTVKIPHRRRKEKKRKTACRNIHRLVVGRIDIDRRENGTPSQTTDETRHYVDILLWPERSRPRGASHDAVAQSAIPPLPGEGKLEGAAGYFNSTFWEWELAWPKLWSLTSFTFSEHTLSWR